MKPAKNPALPSQFDVFGRPFQTELLQEFKDFTLKPEPLTAVPVRPHIDQLPLEESNKEA